MLETQWRKEACCTVTKNVNEYSHYGEQYGVSLKNYEYNYHMTQQFHYWVYALRKP